MSLQVLPQIGVTSLDLDPKIVQKLRKEGKFSIPRSLCDCDGLKLFGAKAPLMPFAFSYSGVSKSIPGGAVHYVECGFGARVLQPADSGVVARFKYLSSMILAGRFGDILERGPNCTRPDIDDMGNCALEVDGMTDCSCPFMSRKLHPQFRTAYEEQVIAQAVDISKHKSSLTITFFAPGRLATELSLLVKLLEQLKKENWKGQINLQFIDYKYGTPALVSGRETLRKEIEGLQNNMLMTRVSMGIATGSFVLGGVVIGLSCKEPKRRYSLIVGVLLAGVGLQILSESVCSGWNRELKPLEKRRVKDKSPLQTLAMRCRQYPNDTRVSESIPQFLTYVQLALPQGIAVKARFFSDADNHISLCAKEGKYRSDLLVGIDFPGSTAVFQKLREQSQVVDGRAVVMYNDPNPQKTQSRVSMRVAGPGGPLVEVGAVVVDA